VASLQQSCLFSLSARGFGPNPALHRLTDCKSKEVSVSKEPGSPEDAIPLGMPGWSPTPVFTCWPPRGAMLGRIEPRNPLRGPAGTVPCSFPAIGRPGYGVAASSRTRTPSAATQTPLWLLDPNSPAEPYLDGA